MQKLDVKSELKIVEGKHDKFKMWKPHFPCFKEDIAYLSQMLDGAIQKQFMNDDNYEFILRSMGANGSLSIRMNYDYKEVHLFDRILGSNERYFVTNGSISVGKEQSYDNFEFQITYFIVAEVKDIDDFKVNIIVSPEAMKKYCDESGII